MIIGNLFSYYSQSLGLTLDPGDVLGVNTTAAGEQIFWAVGDSNTDGRGATVTPVAGGILYLWNGTTFTEITTQSVANETTGGPFGSAWQQFAIDHNANTGKKILLVNSGVGGSNLYPFDGADDHWMGVSGPQGNDMYTPAKDDCDDALAAKGLTKPRAIFIVGLGINDHGAGNTIANITSGLNALITNLTTDYPGVPILYTTTGRNSGSTVDTNLYNIRKVQVAKAEATTDLHIVGAGASCIGAGYYNGDNIHYSTAGQNHFGACYARWLKNSAYTNKWARSIISSHFDELSTARKALISAAVTTEYTNGNYFKLDHWYRGKTTIENNFYFDWTFLGHSAKTGTPTFTANTSIGTPADTSHTFSYASWCHAGTRASTLEDYIEGAELLTRVTVANASMFGGEDVTGGRWIGQLSTGPFTIYRSNDATTSNGPGQLLTVDKFHSTARNAGNKQYLIDAAVSDTEAVASTAAGTFIARIGARNSSGGSATSPISATFGTFFRAKYVGFDLTSFLASNRAISTGW